MKQSSRAFRDDTFRRVSRGSTRNKNFFLNGALWHGSTIMANLFISINVFSNFVLRAEPIKFSFTDLLSQKICNLQAEAATAGLN